jgi:hypothetical protein
MVKKAIFTDIKKRVFLEKIQKDSYYVLGNVLLSQNPAVQVPSTLEGLTVVFEMGTRGSLPPSSPNSQSVCLRLEN